MGRLFEDTVRDIACGWRALRRTPAAATVAVLSLALGIGANSAILSVIDSLMVRSLPVAHPEGLVVFMRDYAGRGTADYVTYPAVASLRDAGIFASVTATSTVERSGIRIAGAATGDLGTLNVGLVSGTYFSTLGVPAALGRVLQPRDEAGGGAPVAVLSASLWRRAFGSASDVVGRVLTIGSLSVSVVGVAGAAFQGENLGEPTDFWIPIALQSQVMPERPGLIDDPNSNWVRGIARLKPAMTIAQAQAAAQAVVGEWPAGTSPFGSSRLVIGPAGRGFSAQRQTLATPLLVLAILVGMVLLLACVNVAILQIARATGRRKELAMRLALGARRGQLVRQLLTEALMLAGLAGLAGFAVSVWLTRLVADTVAAGRASEPLNVNPDLRMLGITAATGLASALVFGVVPALRATGTSIVASLTGSGAGGAEGTRASVRSGKWLVASQVAMSVALVVTAGLFVRTLRNLESSNLGFDREHVWMFWMAPRESGLQGEELATLFARAQAQVEATPGVISASPSSDGVLSGFIGLRMVAVEGRPLPTEGDINAQWNLVGPRFFATLGMPLVAGRDFGPQDTAEAPHVAVVNETMARRFFGNVNPLGKRFGFGLELSHPIEIVGVVKDAKYFSARDPETPMVFLPYTQDAAHIFRMCVVARLVSDDPSLVARVREQLSSLDSSVPVQLVDTTTGQLGRTLTNERLTAWLASFFGILAMLLACIGLYGVMAYAVSRRTREIGIRTALGQTRGAILAEVFRESAVVVVIGLLVGVPGALLGAHAAQALLFGVSANDPITAAGAVGLLVVAEATATLIPAVRASRVDSAVLLRTE